MSALLTACLPRLTMARSGLANGWTWYVMPIVKEAFTISRGPSPGVIGNG